MPDSDARLLRIHGLVQGVGYRHALSQQARALALRGWVRNRRDGSVEALLVGTAETIDHVQQWARQGPPAARVSRVDASPASDAAWTAELAALGDEFQQRATE